MEYLKQLISLFETRTLLLLGVTTLAVASWYYALLERKLIAEPKRIRALFALAIVSLTLAVWLDVKIIRQLRDVPRVLFSRPKNNTAILAQSPDIDVTFSAPVVYKTLAVHTNPPLDFTVEEKGYLWNLLPFGTTLTIVPKTTLPPGESIMVYLANMEGPITKGYGGEQLLEMKVENPEVSLVNPPDKSENVAATQKITFSLSAPILSKDEWTIKSDPAHPFSLEQIDKKTLQANPDEPMRQGTMYKLTLSQSPIVTQRSDKTIVKQLEKRTKSEIQVSTVKAAFVSAFTPIGNAVNPDDPILLTFDQPMKQNTLEKFIRISPEVKLRHSWDDKNNTLTIKHDTFAKDTEYTLTLAKGVETQKGGTIDSDATFRFRTAGPLTLVDVNPADGDKNAQTNQSIILTFDQQIPDSIKDHITISPDIPGSYIINDNVVELKLKNDLPYNTTYTIRIAADAPSRYGLPSKAEKAISFTTKPDQIALDVPMYRQQTNFTCNIAAARMLLSYRGISVTEQNLIDKIGIGGKRGSGNPHKGYVDDFGTFWEAVIKGVTQYRGARLITSGTITDLTDELKKGNPVMTWGQNGWSDPHDISWRATDGTFIKAVNGMHSMVVRGYIGSSQNPTKMLINDPWRGQYELETSEFLRRWSYYKVAMVIE